MHLNDFFERKNLRFLLFFKKKMKALQQCMRMSEPLADESLRIIAAIEGTSPAQIFKSALNEKFREQNVPAIAAERLPQTPCLFFVYLIDYSNQFGWHCQDSETFSVSATLPP